MLREPKRRKILAERHGPMVGLRGGKSAMNMGRGCWRSAFSHVEADVCDGKPRREEHGFWRHRPEFRS